MVQVSQAQLNESETTPLMASPAQVLLGAMARGRYIPSQCVTLIGDAQVNNCHASKCRKAQKLEVTPKFGLKPHKSLRPTGCAMTSPRPVDGE
eukprot:2629633-Amphidinium_carterae.1